MSNTFDGNLKTQLAKNFVNQFGPFSDDKFYVAISRISGVGLDKKTKAEELKTRNNTVLAKRVNPQDGSSVLIKRNDWTEGTIYAKLDSDEDMSLVDDPFYAMNNDKNVYMCIENAGGNTGSRIEPSGTSTDPITLSDGYTWKFMYSVPEDKNLFLDENFIPVNTLPVYPRIANAYNDNRQNQYAVQYEGSVDARNGTIQAISIVSEDLQIFTDAFSESSQNTITSAGGVIAVISGNPISGSVSTASLAGYYIRILSGVAAGEVRRISSNSGDNLVLLSSWTSGKVPKSGDRFEIGVGITVSGDGSGSAAFGKIDSVGKISSIVVYNTGSGYSTASAVVDTSRADGMSGVSSSLTSASSYVFDVLLFSPIGEDPATELFAKHAAFLVKLSGSNTAEDAILGNDFRDVILWKNPKLGSDNANAGKIAGYDDFLTTTVNIKQPSETGTLRKLNTFSNNNSELIVVGADSGLTAKVSSGGIKLDDNIVAGSFSALNLRKSFLEDEILTFIGRNTSSDKFTQSSDTAKVNVTRFKDSDLSVSKEVFTCTTKLDLQFPTNGNYSPALDSGVTGASGSTGLVARYLETSSGGNEATISLTDVKNISGVTHGFRAGETIQYPLASGGIVTGTIRSTTNSVRGPELDLFSGQMPYIQGLTQGIVRVVEQDEIFKFIFEF